MALTSSSLLCSAVDWSLFVLVSAKTLHMQYAVLYLACVPAALVHVISSLCSPVSAAGGVLSLMFSSASELPLR